MSYIDQFFPELSKEDALAKVREIAGWIMQLPTSGVPFIEIGSDSLHEDLVARIINYQQVVKDNGHKI